MVVTWHMIPPSYARKGEISSLPICHVSSTLLDVVHHLLLSGEASSSQARLAVREGLLLTGLHHQHLLPVLGVCLTDPRHPLLLYPHLGLSNLKTCVTRDSLFSIQLKLIRAGFFTELWRQSSYVVFA